MPETLQNLIDSQNKSGLDEDELDRLDLGQPVVQIGGMVAKLLPLLTRVHYLNLEEGPVCDESSSED